MITSAPFHGCFVPAGSGAPAGGTEGGASVSRGAAQAIADDTPAAVTFTAEDRDDG